MHDLDGTQLESDLEMSEIESEEFEFPDESEFPDDVEADSPFDEAEEMDLALEMLEVRDDAELEQFLGKLIRRAARKVRKIIKSPVGRALGGLLRKAAKKALPLLGRAAGTYFGGPAGGAIGARLASSAGRFFGLELEGMSPEDQELEVARRVVRLCGSAATNAADAQEVMSPLSAARSAVMKAAKMHAPGLISGASSAVMSGSRRSGRWIRRGRSIVIRGV